MSREIKVSFLIVIVAASGMAAYNWSRSVNAPSVSVEAAPAAATESKKSAELIDRVRNGRLADYPNTTVGKAFERSFQAPEWKPGLNLQGSPVVTFHGTATYAALKGAGFYIGTWNGVSQGIEAARLVAESERRCGAAPGQTGEDRPSPCMAKAYESIAIPVAFEFSIASDNGVEMTSFDPVFQTFDRDHRLRRDRTAMLAFVYR
jgi:hypothetical protein